VANRIVGHVRQWKMKLHGKIQCGDSPEHLQKVVHLLNFSPTEFKQLQELNSKAVNSGLLTQDEQKSVEEYLGTSAEEFNQKPPEIKIVISRVFEILLKKAA
jgi:hypothetical protein